MSETTQAGGASPPGSLERITRIVALAGGLLSLAIACMVVVSVALRWARVGSVPGDFELVQMATAISVFCFLPLCQIRRGNIMVDTFTARLPKRVNVALDALWDLVYAAMMLILAASLFRGARDAIASGQTTMMLQLPLWPAIVVASALTFFLGFVALVTARRTVRSGS